jgi:hypothetical protein
LSFTGIILKEKHSRWLCSVLSLILPYTLLYQLESILSANGHISGTQGNFSGSAVVRVAGTTTFIIVSLASSALTSIELNITSLEDLLVLYFLPSMVRISPGQGKG